ncbi:putative salicylate hydroxylase [Amniculicola lignicola CBS 123094]|uniref:Putative salicylate hydroxylase n=1 Tax=Amniculicola lignicola CBS 123094 TaxID=1392246 RepID=A0A6A5WDY3_9PLEO|nr:putative salicylate hydroxylase [Amniculicola lignicola CBS 123094]
MEADKALGEENSLNGQMHCGYGSHIVSYPVEHGDYINMVAVVNEPGKSSMKPQPWTVPGCKEQFARKFEGWSPQLIGLMSEHLLLDVWALSDFLHSSLYYKGRTCLLGNTAHASTPNLGAGAGMAMEDAFILSHVMASVGVVSNMENAFHAYDTVRRPRTQTLVEYSRKVGMANHFLSPIRDDVNCLLREFEAWLCWLWHKDLEAQLVTAQQLLIFTDDYSSYISKVRPKGTGYS